MGFPGNKRSQAFCLLLPALASTQGYKVSIIEGKQIQTEMAASHEASRRLGSVPDYKVSIIEGK